MATPLVLILLTAVNGVFIAHISTVIVPVTQESPGNTNIRSCALCVCGRTSTGSLKRKKNKQTYHKYISQTVSTLPDPGNGSNPGKAQLMGIPSWLWSGRDDSYGSKMYLRQFLSSVVPLSKQLSMPLHTRLRGMHRPLPQVNSVVLLQFLNRHPTSSLLSPQSS